MTRETLQLRQANRARSIWILGVRWHRPRTLRAFLERLAAAALARLQRGAA